MVSKASEDLPDPLSPVTTVRVLRGISTSMFFRLCCRAPRTEILVMAILCRGLCPFRNVDKGSDLADSGIAQLTPYLSRQQRRASTRVDLRSPEGSAAGRRETKE